MDILLGLNAVAYATITNITGNAICQSLFLGNGAVASTFAAVFFLATSPCTLSIHVIIC